jgi:hypothetical protein
VITVLPVKFHQQTDAGLFHPLAGLQYLLV